MNETELYKPIEKYFIEKGYIVKGEVKNCDLVALKEEELIVIEMKLSINLTLILQAIERQKVADYVYVATPKLPKNLQTRRKILTLLKRLNIGLFIIKNNKLEEIISPFEEYNFYNNKSKRNKIKKEILTRKNNLNIGGTNKTKIITAYREQALFIAYVLLKYGNLSPKKIKKITKIEKSGQILYTNFYNFYTHINRGVYGLSNNGKKYLEKFILEYSELKKIFENMIKENGGLK
ncbi:hypothetical protein EV215_0842 [Hypnocyclicus thermotrophus]|uniref:Endonuclease n=1 Tax=Hypnocyclicus thermotrophus TaxID=1627895 RepID=A0AA46DZI7_9FUSO|nr:DUF2161 family putative PD-(D/E)XK-type phosphodiesterase [Hypnocyclicus thermotrophus]TDT71467.1 hypothetical protein EV215_0842 [Hypnocyclicus thermotrophus]